MNGNSEFFLCKLTTNSTRILSFSLIKTFICFSPVLPSHVVTLVDLLEKEEINRNIVGDILELIFEGNTKSPSEVMS